MQDAMNVKKQNFTSLLNETSILRFKNHKGPIALTPSHYIRKQLIIN